MEQRQEMEQEEKLIYHLVSPHMRRDELPRPFFWMLDKGEHWLNIVKSLWREKHPEDVVTETVEVYHITELDWKKTPLHNQGLVSGWLSREGRFYGCPSWLHDMLAHCVLGMKVAELERIGWVRIHNPNWFVCQHRLSAEQRNYLSIQGCTVPDED